MYFLIYTIGHTAQHPHLTDILENLIPTDVVSLSLACAKVWVQ
jgi:hypothetical protein